MNINHKLHTPIPVAVRLQRLSLTFDDLEENKVLFFLHEKYVTHVHKQNMQNPCHRSGMEWNVCFILRYDAWYSRFESIIIPMTIKDQSKKITKQLCWVVEWEGNKFFIQMLRTQKVRD